MSENNDLDAQFPNLKKWVTIPLVLIGLFFLVAGFGLFGGGNPILGVAVGLPSIVVGIGFWFNAKWARIIVGTGIILLGLYIALAPFIHIISAGTVGFQKYDPFAVLPPWLMAAIVLFGLGTAVFGVVIIAFVLEKKSTPVVTLESTSALSQRDELSQEPRSLQNQGRADNRVSGPDYLSPIQYSEIKILVQQGRKIDAIKLVREYTNIKMTEAKDYIDQLEMKDK